MNKHLKDLISLSKIDNEISSFDDKQKAIKNTLNALVEEKEILASEMTELSQSIKEDKVKKNRNDIHLQELNDKLKSIAQKMKNIKSEKELKALSLEEDIAKDQINFANEEILRLEKTVITKEEKLEKLEEDIQKLQAQQEEELKNVQIALDNLDKDRKNTYHAKEKLIATMDQKIITYYEKIKRWAKDTTVVEVKKQACYGCFMRLNDKTYADVIKSEDIISCPHCGRILYHNPE
jgi:predicted  nucleic acid-binding Zn-ribbon protein